MEAGLPSSTAELSHATVPDVSSRSAACSCPKMVSTNRFLLKSRLAILFRMISTFACRKKECARSSSFLLRGSSPRRQRPLLIPPTIQPALPAGRTWARNFSGGLETFGTRETLVIEAGLIGNDTAIQTTREYWYSPKLGVNLSSKLQDPRIGTQDFEVSDVVLGEPDAKLFKLPPNSKLIDLRDPAQSSSPN